MALIIKKPLSLKNGLLIENSYVRLSEIYFNADAGLMTFACQVYKDKETSRDKSKTAITPDALPVQLRFENVPCTKAQFKAGGGFPEAYAHVDAALKQLYGNEAIADDK